MLLYTRERVPGPQTVHVSRGPVKKKKEKGRGKKLTVFQSVDTTSKRQLIRTNNTPKHSQKTARNPPSNRVTQEVDLLASVVLSPEANTPKQERPLEWLTGVRVATG